MRLPLSVIALLSAAPAFANTMEVQFADGAPKDSIVFQNNGCPLQDTTIVIDLRDTPAGLIFDVSAGGAGLSVFQPVESTAGQVAISPVADGGQVLHLFVPSLPSGDSIRLTADLDDTATGRQTIVDGAEMLGARVTVATGAASATASFDATGLAVVALPATDTGCLAA